MTTVSIVYFSGMGHTAKFAEAVQKGAASVPDVKANLVAIKDDDIVKGRYQNETALAQLDASDAIIFGTPTYMGGPSAQFKAFADATGAKWYAQLWRDKIASGFTVSNSPSGDKFSTLQYLHTLAMQHGMVWIGLGELPLQPNGVNRLGSFSGAMGQAGQESPEEKPGAEDKLTAEILGKRVAAFALKLKK